MNPVPERLAALRKKMQENNVAFYIVPTDDFHQDEYVGDHFKARVYITGFTGSAGTALITETEAFLWTDGRYFIQAAKELEGSTVELMKMSEPGVPTISQFLKEHVKPGQILGFDGRTLSMDEGTGYRDAAEKAGGAVRYDLDLIDEIWEDRPPMSDKPAWLLPVEYAGKTAEDKIRDIREKMAEAGADVHVETTPDDICWTLNIRGDDIDYFPLMLSYALITADAYHLYVDDKKLSPEIGQYLKDLGVTVHPYNDVYEDAKKISGAVMVDPNKVNYALYHNIPADCTKINVMSPEETFKTVKNPVEVSNIRKAEIKDSVAHIRFMKWLKENVGKIRITEISASDKLDEFRAEMGNFIKPSFEPISSYAEHAAIVHYAPTPETDAELKPEGMLLTDTGAGFWEGSTDITRTYVLGPITQKMKEDFTVVAISNLSLGNAVFTKGITGVALDNLARNPFWKRRMNYNHGTGHGVGYLLNIHESPASYRSRFVEGDNADLDEGLVITDEPSFYVEGSHGIRLENELLVVNDVANEFGQFMRLEPITFVPFDLDAIEPEIMTAEERTMLNDYHKKVYEITSPYLNDEEKEWLRKYTREV